MFVLLYSTLQNGIVNSEHHTMHTHKSPHIQCSLRPRLLHLRLLRLRSLPDKHHYAALSIAIFPMRVSNQFIVSAAAGWYACNLDRKAIHIKVGDPTV